MRHQPDFHSSKRCFQNHIAVGTCFADKRHPAVPHLSSHLLKPGTAGPSSRVDPLTARLPPSSRAQTAAHPSPCGKAGSGAQTARMTRKEVLAAQRQLTQRKTSLKTAQATRESAIASRGPLKDMVTSPRGATRAAIRPKSTVRITHGWSGRF